MPIPIILPYLVISSHAQSRKTTRWGSLCSPNAFTSHCVWSVSFDSQDKGFTYSTLLWHCKLPTATTVFHIISSCCTVQDYNSIGFHVNLPCCVWHSTFLSSEVGYTRHLTLFLAICPHHCIASSENVRYQNYEVRLRITGATKARPLELVVSVKLVFYLKYFTFVV